MERIGLNKQVGKGEKINNRGYILPIKKNNANLDRR